MAKGPFLSIVWFVQCRARRATSERPIIHDCVFGFTSISRSRTATAARVGSSRSHVKARPQGWSRFARFRRMSPGTPTKDSSSHPHVTSSFRLRNSTDGGEGMKGISADAIERRKRSAAITNATPETQRRRAEAAARCYELRIRKTREALGTPENRLRAAEHSRTLWAKPEMKARKAATMKAAWADPIKAAARCAAISEGKRLGWARKKASLPA